MTTLFTTGWRVRRAAALAAVVLLAGPLAARAQVTREDYIRAQRLLSWNAEKLVFKTQVVPNWIEKTDRFWYRNATRTGKDFVLVDPARNTRAPAFDHARLAAGLSRASGRAYEPTKLPFDTFTYTEQSRAIAFDVEKEHWRCDLVAYECVKIDKPAEPAENELRSPDGRWVAFTRDHNLWVRPLGGGEASQLSRDGIPYYDYASTPDARTTAVADKLRGRKLPPVALWSPDSKKIVTHRLDQRRVREFHLVQSVHEKGFEPVLHTYRFPIVADPELPLAELVVFDLEQHTAVRVQAEPLLAPYRAPIEFNWVWWSEDNERIYFLREERGLKGLRLEVADARTGQVRPLVEERRQSYVEPAPMFYGRPNMRALATGEVIWWSERDGWGHLYLYDATGAWKNQITSGPWLVRELVHVDERARQVYFTAGGREEGRDPYLRHLYRVNLDGSGLQLLTPEDADHQVAFSPTGRYFVDVYSRIDLAPASVLRAADGSLVRKLEDTDLELLLATGWKWPERFSVKARDAVTDLYGALFRPSTFDPNKKYPVIDDIYPGPQVIRTPKAFPRVGDPLAELINFWFWQPQALAELGFIVVTIDGLGTPLRSKAFHDFPYGNMGDAGGLEDHIVGLRQLAARYPQMDLTRVGIFGHSGGGFATGRAMLAYPDFYKVGVSSAGNHDQRGYLAAWGEKYQGLLAGDNYDNQSNRLLAANLKGKLLLAYGDLDDNVHPALTLQLVDALIKANKDFDMLVLPNRFHDFSRDPYFIRRLWDYFVRHLAGEEPPTEFKLEGPEYK